MPKPQYPMLSSDPTVKEAFGMTRVSDGIWAVGVTVGSWGLGFLRGKPIRHATAGMMGTIGATFASMYILQTVRNRLLGGRENVREQKYYDVEKVNADFTQSLKDQGVLLD
mmetsp:Transcript_2808/g.3772  ORF Transcript_2808/g.3772 Transcript_2808/m.3772 type:complete len:111 (+) Transcript_2808:203-535(+)|eukprot:CAMPEP_0198140044 /NCGR_PEP_ID=MMETSP1443-20131203/3264_1 /TAXON_ID=186043 /ORGANISM="Entomoneis sp., Strain CCMP2396" /LENGTH=110 /DNA_ID=CAMNT_0043802353 /DNA_START=166 /DNA_END=498 /DNA_ORIENTATION=-